MNKLYLIAVIGIFFNLIAMNCLSSEISHEIKLVNKAIDAMENCLHWAGEIGDQSEERTQEIMMGAKRDCAEAKIYARQAYAQYPNNISLASQLFRYIVEGRFSVNTAELELLCRNSAQFYGKNRKNNYPVRYWYFVYKCLK